MSVVDEDEFVGQMDTAVDFLAHYGVKGMRWGQRRAAKKEHRAWKKDARSSETANAVFQEAIKTSKKDFKAINNSPKYKGKDLTKDPRLARDYDRDVSQKFNDHMVDASVKLASNKTGDRVMVFQFDRQVGMMRANEMKKIEHADGDTVSFRAVMNDLGHILELIPPEDEASLQQAEATGAFLAHYGVKGMKWGKRKTRPDEAARAKRFGKSGVIKEAASEDADRVNQIHGRVKAQKSTQMLSNKELQKALERMRLEQAYSQMTGGLDKTRKQKAQGFVKSLIDDTISGGQKSGQVIINKEVSGKMNEAFNNYKQKGQAAGGAPKVKKPKQAFGFAA